MQVTVPITFYGNGAHKTVDGPENITIKLTGKRDDLYSLNTQTIALHCNIDEMEEGEHLIDVTSEKLFLPNTIKLVHCVPN